MGFGATPANKRRIIAASRVHHRDADALQVYDVLSVDACAMFRSMVPISLDARVSPMIAVKKMFWPVFAKFKGVKINYIALDDPLRIPEVRADFHGADRYAQHPPGTPIPVGSVLHENGRCYRADEVPVTDAQITELGMYHMPAKWIQFWNNSEGKARLWEVIIECITTILEVDTGGVQYIIENTKSERVYYPPVDAEDLPLCTYGEGDLKSIAAATYYAGLGYNPLVITIDWDVPLAVFLLNSNIHVLIGRVHVDADTDESFEYSDKAVALTRKSAIKKFPKYVPGFEILEIPRLIERVPDRIARCHTLMLCLCSAKIDYNKGLQRFGFTQPSIVRLIERFMNGQVGLPAWLENMYWEASPLERCLKFTPHKFAEALRMLPRGNGKKRTDCIADFNREVQSIIWCVRYFAGFDSTRFRGGPPRPDYNDPLFPGMSSVTELLASRHEFEPVIFYESHAITTLEVDPQIIYDGRQLDCIRGAAESVLV